MREYVQCIIYTCTEKLNNKKGNKVKLECRLNILTRKAFNSDLTKETPSLCDRELEQPNKAPGAK